MTSTSTGNRGAALPTQPYPATNIPTVGPRQMPETAMHKAIPVRYTSSDKYINSAGNIPQTFRGTPATNWSVKEYGDNAMRKTILTCNTAHTITVASGAGNLAVGEVVYTFPAVDVAIGGGASIVGSVTASVTPAATPAIGLGTTIGSGAVAALATNMRNVVGSNTIPAANGTAFDYPDILLVALTGASNPALYLNFANSWAASDVLTIPVGFAIHVHWKPLADIEQSGYTYA